VDEEVKKILKQVNRRLMNAESSIRLVEQRIDTLEGTITAIERKVGRNTRNITELSSDKGEVERLRGRVIKLSAAQEGSAAKSDVDALRKYLDLILLEEKE
jgi:predicted  nucleic acid-binding Zn-ribbon protein